MSKKEYIERESEAYKIYKFYMKYGGETKIGDILDEELGDNKFICPKCKGRGYIKIEYNCYPAGYPDSLCAYEAGYKDIECDVCGAFGFTANRLKPRMVQDGWEIDND